MIIVDENMLRDRLEKIAEWAVVTKPSCSKSEWPLMLDLKLRLTMTALKNSVPQTTR